MLFRVSAPAAPAPGKLGKGGPKGKAAPTRAKFVCPGCKAAAWGKPGLNLICGDCGQPMNITPLLLGRVFSLAALR